MRWIYVIIAVAVLLALYAVFGPSSAQQMPTCVERRLVVDQLAKQFKEEPTALGINKNGNLLELFSSKAGTWTLVLSMPSGKSCVMDTGHSWQQDKDHLNDPGA